jgi:hypothetical protein
MVLFSPSAGRRHAALAAVLVGGAALGLFAQSDDREVDRDRYVAHVRFLASDELQGRGNGTPGLERAAEYIAAAFEKAGLSPAGDNGSWFQRFEIVTGIEAGPGNALGVRGPSGEAALALAKDYYPISVDHDRGGPPASSPLLPLVFAGYGISDPANRYDDYAGIDVSGKAVLVFTHEPQEDDGASRFGGRRFTTHAAVLTKAMQARKHGARLLVLVDDPTHPVPRSRFEAFGRDPQAEAYGLPVVHVRRDVLQPLLTPSIDLEQVHDAIDADLVPRSRVLPSVRVDLQEQYTRVRRPVRNVVGILRGASKPDEAVVLGAHYDHLGLGGRTSLAADRAGEIHNGADDNASGTAAILEIAHDLSDPADRPARSVVFAAFAAEEIGLLGSAHYVNRPAVPLDRTIAMVNLDMIGRPGGRVLISGFEKAPALEEDLRAAQKAAGTDLEVRRFSEGAGVGASDDSSFVLRRVPALAFFSGFHADYHRPSDDPDKLEIGGALEVTRLAAALTQQIASRTSRPEFVATPQTAHGGQAPAGTSSVGGYGAYFGSVPDFAEDGAGVKFAEVREGSPAAAAGLRRGDVLIRFDGEPIKTLYDFTFALRDRRAGDRVEVVVLRDGKEVKASVQLANRP